MKFSIKMEKDTLVLKFDSERSFSEQKEEVEKYLAGMKNFLANGDVKFAYDGIELEFDEEVELCRIADEVFGKEVKFCHKKRPPHEIMRHVMGNNERIVRRYIGTVKEGECVESNGDLIVIGDVNPTSQLNAEGDIYVIGNLRGVAHAGCTGDTGAVVYAMKMNPIMVKIADLIGFNREMSKSNANGMAMVENGEIKVKLV